MLMPVLATNEGIGTYAPAEEDELDRFLWGRQLNCVKVVR